MNTHIFSSVCSGLTVDWTLAISSSYVANSGLTVFGHVAFCLAYLLLPMIKTRSHNLAKRFVNLYLCYTHEHN